MQIVSVLFAVLLAGCATQEGVIEPYASVPADCAAIEAEMCALASADADAANVSTGVSVLSSATPIVAAAGMIPSGYAWVAYAPYIISAFVPTQHTVRLWTLRGHATNLHCPAFACVKSS